MNNVTSTPHARSRPSPRTGARRILAVAPLVLVGATLTILPYLSQPADAGAPGRSGGRTVTLPAVLPTPSEGSPVLSLPWGDGPGAVGLADSDGGERRGPEAFAVTSDGRMVILDSVNRRLLTVGSAGSPAGVIPLDLRSARFLAVTPERIHVLDADDDRQLQTFTWDGHLEATRPLAESEGPVTALLVDPDGSPLVEIAHDATQAVDAPADTRGLSAAGTRGRPAGTGGERRLSANLGSDGHPRVERRDLARGLEESWEVDPGAACAVDHLVSLDADAQGRVTLGVRLRDRPGAGHRSPGSLLLTRLDEEGGPLLLAEDLYAYLGAPYTVGGDGRVYAPVADPDGYRIVVHDFSEVTR